MVAGTAAGTGAANRVALQQALGTGACVVTVPEGRWFVDHHGGPIRLPQGSTLAGVPGRSILVSAVRYADPNRGPAGHPTMFANQVVDGRGAGGITISGITIDGGYSLAEIGSRDRTLVETALLFDPGTAGTFVDDITISHVSVVGWSGIALDARALRRGRITDNRISNTLRGGLIFRWRNDDLVIARNHVVDTEDDALAINASPQGDGCPTASMPVRLGGSSTNVLVKDNTFGRKASHSHPGVPRDPVGNPVGGLGATVSIRGADGGANPTASSFRVVNNTIIGSNSAGMLVTPDQSRQAELRGCRVPYRVHPVRSMLVAGNRFVGHHRIAVEVRSVPGELGGRTTASGWLRDNTAARIVQAAATAWDTAGSRMHVTGNRGS